MNAAISSSTSMLWLARKGQAPLAAEQNVHGVELDLIQRLLPGWIRARSPGFGDCLFSVSGWISIFNVLPHVMRVSVRVGLMGGVGSDPAPPLDFELSVLKQYAYHFTFKYK